MKTFKPTDAMATAAKRALKWHEDIGSGMTLVGLRRANQIAKKENISLDTVKRMHSFFSRHEKASKGAKGFRFGEKGYPSDGRKAWDAWGGDPGQAWAANIVESEEKRTNAARLSRGKGSRQVRLGRRGRFGPLLLKHIAYKGEFTDASGQSVTIDDAYLSEAVKGAKVLMDNGFNVQNFTDHDTNSSNDVLGTWRGIYYDEKRGDLWGVVEAHSDEAAAKMERLDTSAVFDVDIHVRDDLSVPFAITRIDTVPQGAVTGTMPYVRLSRHRRGMRKGNAMSFTKALARAFGAESGDLKEVDDAVMAALESDEASVEDIGAMVVEALKEEMASEESDDKEEMASEEESEDKEEMACDSDKEEMAARLARLEKREIELTLDGAGVDAKQRKRLLSVYDKTAKKAGHELAVESIKTALSMRQTSEKTKTVRPAKRQFASTGSKKVYPVAELIRKRHGKGAK